MSLHVSGYLVNSHDTSWCNSFPQWRSLNVVFIIFSWYHKVVAFGMNTGHESNSYIEIYFQHLLPPFVCSFMKVIASSRFNFSIYYPRWVSRCNSLIGHESNSSIKIYFQHLLPPSLYCLVCLCSLSYVISFSNLRYPYSLWDISPPVRVVW